MQSSNDAMYRLLIVDDEPYIAEGVKHLIDWNRFGFTRIETAKNYQEAVDKSVEIRPHLAILDICIGESRGYEIIKHLKSLSLPTVYVMMSGYDEFEYARQSLLQGAKNYLLKPIDPKELEKVVSEIVVEELGGIIENHTSGNELTDPVLGLRYTKLSNLANKVILIVKGEYMKNLSLKSIADMFRMNSTYLGQIFIKETGMKFSEYLMAYRLLLAKERIETTGDKISVIASNVGYSNLSYFYIQFRDYFGFSPSSLRNTEEDDKETIT